MSNFLSRPFFSLFVKPRLNEQKFFIDLILLMSRIFDNWSS